MSCTKNGLLKIDVIVKQGEKIWCKCYGHLENFVPIMHQNFGATDPVMRPAQWRHFNYASSHLLDKVWQVPRGCTSLTLGDLIGSLGGGDDIAMKFFLGVGDCGHNANNSQFWFLLRLWSLYLAESCLLCLRTPKIPSKSPNIGGD